MADFYVDAVSGSDADAGTSEALAKATIAAGIALMAAGDTLWVKDSADYTITASLTINKSGSTAAGPVTIRGYALTPGDDGVFTLRTATNGITLVAVQGDGITLRQFRLAHEAATRGLGIVATGSNRMSLTLADGEIVGCTVGIDGRWVTDYAFPGLVLTNVTIRDCATIGLAAHDPTVTGCRIIGCGTAWQRGTYDPLVPAVSRFTRTVVSGCTTHGLHANATARTTIAVEHCVLRGGGASGSGIMLAGAAVGGILTVSDSVIEGWGGYGIGAEHHPLGRRVRNCAFRSNTSGPVNATYVPAGVETGRITLTADPFTDAANEDFTPNVEVGGGLLLRGAASDGTDVGAVQSVPPTPAEVAEAVWAWPDRTTTS